MTCSNTQRRLALSGLLVIIAVAMPLPAGPGSCVGASLAATVTGIAIPSAAADIQAGDAGSLNALNSYRLALLEMKGHLSVARELLQTGSPGAEYHLREPIEKLFQRIEPELRNRGAPLTSDIVAPLQRVTETDPDMALALLDSATSAIDGSYAQSGATDAPSILALSEALLRQAVDLYANSVKDNAVTDVPGYQTGRAFANQAEALVRHSTGLRRKPEYEAALASIVLIRQSWPGVEPPPIVFGPGSVAQRLNETVAIMDEMR